MSTCLLILICGGSFPALHCVLLFVFVCSDDHCLFKNQDQAVGVGYLLRQSKTISIQHETRHTQTNSSWLSVVAAVAFGPRPMSPVSLVELAACRDVAVPNLRSNNYTLLVECPPSLSKSVLVVVVISKSRSVSSSF